MTRGDCGLVQLIRNIGNGAFCSKEWVLVPKRNLSHIPGSPSPDDPNYTRAVIPVRFLQASHVQEFQKRIPRTDLFLDLDPVAGLRNPSRTGGKRGRGWALRLGGGGGRSPPAPVMLTICEQRPRSSKSANSGTQSTSEPIIFLPDESKPASLSSDQTSLTTDKSS